MFVVFAAVTALAGEPVVADPPPGEVTALPPDDQRLVPASSAEMLDEAWRRIDLHDFEGARMLAEQVLSRADDQQVRALAALGGAWELQGDDAQALTLYERALAASPPPDLRTHLLFRQAEALGKLGRPADALAALGQLGDPEEHPYLDSLKIRLLEGILSVEAGDRELGFARIDQTLDGIGVDEVTWYQARARLVRADDLCDQADAQALVGKDKEQVRALQARAALILRAEGEIVTVLKLQEPEWGLRGLLRLGESYERLADEMIALSPPKKLRRASQRELYTSEVRAKAVDLYVKSSRYYGQGLDVAVRLSWKSAVVRQLEDAQARALKKAMP